MARTPKRHRRAEPPPKRAEPEVIHGGAEAEEGDEDPSATDPAPAEPSAAAAGKGDEEAEAGDAEDVVELLEPFTRDELLGLLTDACLRDPALLARIAASAASDAAHRRVFVHGLGPGATSAALAAAFAPFGALDECHAVADRATGRCRGYGFVTFRRRADARRALADASKRVGGRPVACQLASLGPVSPSSSSFSDRKLFVGNVPERAAHDELRAFFSRFGEIEEGPLGADRATGRFRGYAIFFYKSPEGLRRALEEPTKVFDGCELQCRRAYMVSKRKHDAASPLDTGGRSNGGAASTALPSVQPQDLALPSKESPLASNPPVVLMKGRSSPAVATGHFSRNAVAGGAGILGPPPVATAVPSSPGQSTLCKLRLVGSKPPVGLTAAKSISTMAAGLFGHNARPGRAAGLLVAPPAGTAAPSLMSQSAASMPPSRCGAAPEHDGLSEAANAGASPMLSTIRANDAPSSLQVQGLGALKSSILSSSMSTSASSSQTYVGSTKPGLIQHYLGR
ncbi:hypothetical protein ACP4OV_006020 [Aristida adscensionis]